MSIRYREFEGDKWLELSLNLGNHQFSMVAEFIEAAGGNQPLRRLGKKAKVFKLKEKSGYFALKVFFKKYAVAENAISTSQLLPYANVPGLKVCQREMVYDTDAYNINEPGLQFAILMPWIPGKAWAEIVANGEALTERECMGLVRQMATVLKGLEARGLTHADISSNNVFIQTGSSAHIELIDVEDMYHKDFVPPEHAPAGTPGYNHPPSKNESYWNPYGDRFAGAMIMAEMLTWHHPGIRSQCAEASYFQENEMCKPNHPKYKTMIAALREHSEKVAALFTKAWNSKKLSDCPSLREWFSALQNIKVASTKIQAESSTGNSSRVSLNLTSGLPPSLQTRFVSHITCYECGARVGAITPTDHAGACSQHPNNFKLALDSDWLTQNPLPLSKFSNHTRSLLERILGEKDSTCDECGNQIDSGKIGSAHKLTCSEHPLNKSISLFSGLPNKEPEQPSNPFSQLSEPFFQTCKECSNLISNDNGKDHKETCSNHPDYQPPSPQRLSRPSTLPNLNLEICDECGNYIIGDAPGLSHEITCSKHPLYKPKPRLLDPPNTRIRRSGSQFPSLQNLLHNACEECNEFIWKDGDRNHKVTCSKHPDYQAPDLSYDTCGECGYLIFGGDIRNHKITCSKHPDYKPPRSSRFSDIGFVPIEDVQPGGDDPIPTFAFGLTDSETCSECGMTIRRVGTVEYGHLHRCSKKNYRIR